MHFDLIVAVPQGALPRSRISGNEMNQERSS
jgi:hypothetical protein